MPQDLCHYSHFGRSDKAIMPRDLYRFSPFYRADLAEFITTHAFTHLVTQIRDARARIWLRQFGQDIADAAAERAKQMKRRRL